MLKKKNKEKTPSNKKTCTYFSHLTLNRRFDIRLGDALYCSFEGQHHLHLLRVTL